MTNVPRWLGIDLGKKRTGVALSDPTGTLGSPLMTLSERDQALVDRLLQLVEEHRAAGLVVGYPLNMDGTRGSAAKKAERLRRALEKAGAPRVELLDERLTTAQALRGAREVGARNVGDKLDQMAAVIILQTFLERQSEG